MSAGEIVAHIADFASIIALCISVYAAIAITQVKRQMVGKVRLPELIKAIERDASAIAALMDGYEENRNQIAVELAKCEAHLRTVRTSVTPARARAKAITRMMNSYSTEWLIFGRNRDRRAEAWAIYTRLNGLVEQLREILADQKVTG